MNFNSAAQKARRIEAAKFDTSSSPYDIYVRIKQFYDENKQKDDILLNIYVNGRINIKIYHKFIYVNDFFNKKHIFKMKSDDEKAFFMSNLKSSHKKFESYKKSNFIFMFSIIDGCGLQHIYIRSIKKLTNIHKFMEIKHQIFKNINFLIDYHNKQDLKFAKSFTFETSPKNICPGCIICDTIEYYGQIVQMDYYSKVYVIRNQVFGTKVKDFNYLSKRLSKFSIPKIKSLTNNQLLNCIPHLILFLNLDLNGVQYAELIGQNKKIQKDKIREIINECFKRGIFSKQHYASTNPNQPSYNPITIYRQNIFSTDKRAVYRQHHISVQYPNGTEKTFKNVAEASRYYGFSQQLIRYHLDRLHSPLQGKIFQSY